MIFMICSLPVLAFIYDEFWHRFWFHFGTPLALNAMLVGDRLFDDFWDWVFIHFEQKTAHGLRGVGPSFPHFFDPVPQGVFLDVPWLTLVPFWFPFGSLLAPCWSF